MKTRLELLKSFLFGNTKATYLFFLLLFLLVWCGLRLPWLDCDGGVPSVWEYGYFATDEGFYLDGGKEKFLWGHFVDLVRMESHSYGFSPGTELLSWLAYCIFGLSTWTWRIPFALINFTAWITLFHFLARRTRPVFSFLLCTALSCTPLILTYERTASNDILIASLLVMAYIVATGKKWWSTIFAALLCASISLVKPSVFILMPIVLAGILSRKKLKSQWLDAGCFVVSTLLFIALLQGGIRLLVLPDAVAQGVSVKEIITRSSCHYPLPSLLDFPSTFKGLSSFPRYPADLLLGVWSIVLTVFPLAMLFRRLGEGRCFHWDHRLLLYITVPAYVAAISIMNTLYTHYYIPMLIILPILWVEMRQDLRSETDRVVLSSKFATCFIFFLSLAIGGSAWLLGENSVDKQTLSQFFSLDFNLPKKNVWHFVWPYAATLVGTLVVLARVVRGRGWPRTVFCGFFGAVCVFASVSLAQLPHLLWAPFVKVPQNIFVWNLSVTLALGSLFLLFLATLPNRMRRPTVWFLAFPSIVLAGFLACPNWQTSMDELLQPGTHIHEKAAAELAKILPKDAILLGERANQVLMSLPIRPASTFASNSDPIPVIKTILAKDPHAKLYAIVDPQHKFSIPHYEANGKWCKLRLVTKLELPSFSLGDLIEVPVFSIQAQPEKP